ncbi:MAG: MATE family efflux transporter [Ruminococcus sp.]|jgi:Na+-driven multidrug efflux pump
MTTTTTASNPLGTEPINKLLVRFAVPSIIAMLVSALYNIVDQFFIGHSVGTLGNAATNVAFPLTITCTALSLMCGIGGAANFNLSMGGNEKEKAKRYAGNAIFLLFSLGVLLCLIVRIFLKPMMNLFGATPDILDYSLTYTGITSLGFPFLILATGGSNLIRADGSPKFSMICTLTGAVLNTILDPLFIFRFDMGMAGAALATIIGQIVSGIMVIIYFTRFKTVHLTLKSLVPSFQYCKDIVRLGMAPCFNQLAMMVVQIAMNNILRYYGAQSNYGSEIPLACAGIISKVNMIFFSLCIGTSQGLQPIVSFNYGAKKYRRVREAYLKAAAAATIISCIAFLCFRLFPRQIIGLFGSGSEEYFQFAEQYFHIFLFFTFINGLQPVSSNFFTSIGKAAKGIFLSLTRQIIFLLPLIIILPMFMGIDGVMYSAPIADFMAAVLVIIFITREMKLLNRLIIVGENEK